MFIEIILLIVLNTIQRDLDILRGRCSTFSW